MGDLWLLFLLPLSLVAFHGVKGCLDCDPKFIEDIKILIEKLIPPEVPGRNYLIQRQIKETIHISTKVSYRDKMLRVLDVQNVVSLRSWLKQEYEKLGDGKWKGVFILQGKLLEVRQNLESKLKETLKTFSEVACSEDCIVTEGPVLDCWTCLRITTHCFRGEYCGEDSKKAESREIALFLILLAEAVVFGSTLLLFHFCVSHRRKMKAIRRLLKNYLEKKLEELIRMAEEKKKKESGTRR
ncbi:PREDICTED: izumo sperm-egg fusion protein 3-like [Chrysochloris asiatica]|uniref:Izumo sperm-egg fusion protein 3-like n=1 Tax=Chrysochloris asiatica TaxID=185453 RepID=A0A9B0WRH1_CHRAS|nr:PREDICTED: izumo sperm-egg fusion protein 3-like [Chrysochloris asiatica]